MQVQIPGVISPVPVIPRSASTRRPRKAKPHYLHLRRQGVNEDFLTVDAVYGLRGVCQALCSASQEIDPAAANAEEPWARDRENDHVRDLAQAAKVLSAIVGDRVEY